MKIENIDVKNTITNAQEMLKKETSISPAFKTIIDVLLLLVTVMFNRLSLNSSNSSIPPSKDSDKEKKKKTRKDKGQKRSKRKQGGQAGHEGSTLTKSDFPDEVEEILIDRRTIPVGTYQSVGFESRQVVDIKLSVIVKEYRAEILENNKGEQYQRFPHFC